MARDKNVIIMSGGDDIVVEVRDNYTSFEGVYGDPSSNPALTRYIQNKIDEKESATISYVDEKNTETLNSAEKFATQLAYRSGSTIFLILGELPVSGEPNIIYFIPKEDMTEDDEYNEYVWVGNHFELLGGDLHEYYTRVVVDTLLELKQDAEDFNLETEDKTIVGAINELKNTKAGIDNLVGTNGIVTKAEDGKVYLEITKLTSANFDEDAIVDDLDDEDIYITGTIPTIPTSNAVKKAIAGKEYILNKTDDDEANTAWNYPSSKALHKGLAKKIDRDDETVTKAGNEFNGESQLVKLTEDGKLPALDGSNLTNLQQATTSQKGLIQLATPEQVSLGLDTKKAVTPANLKTELDKKQNKLVFDGVPTDNSPNPITSEGVFESLKGKVNVEEGKGLSSNDFTDELKQKLEEITVGEIGVTSVNGRVGEVRLTKEDVDLDKVDNTSDAEKNSANATLTNKTINADNNTVKNLKTANFKYTSISDNIAQIEEAVDTKFTTERAVRVELDKKQNKLFFDSEPLEDSIKPVTSRGIFEALQTKVDVEEGKSLTSNDFTDELKSKLENLDGDAEKNSVISVNGKDGVVELNKADIGLNKVDNTSDLEKPISNATRQLIETKQDALKPGENVVLAGDGTISFNPRPYVAGKDIEILDYTISANVITHWGEIEGLITNQQDLINLINTRASKNAFDSAVFEINNRIDDLEIGMHLALLELEEKIDKKQDKLIVGNNITITDENVISADLDWGKIRGNIEDQFDLKQALDSKADTTSVPTKTSQLINDSDFTTQDYVDETKQGKLTAGPGITITEDNKISSYTTSVDWGTIIGDITNQEDLQTILVTKANTEDIPAKTSQLINDSDFTTQEYVDETKQGKLTAGAGIVITEDNKISATISSIDWGNIEGELTDQQDLKDALDLKANLSDVDGVLKRDNIIAGQNIILEELTGGNLKISSRGGSGGILIDEDTLVENSGGIVSVQGVKTMNGGVMYFWEGTKEEYEESKEAGIIQDNWNCYITDDEEDIMSSMSWGSLFGNITDQEDLQEALDSKQDTLVSGTSIKTINGQEVLGEGNIEISLSSSITYDSEHKRLTWR